jgi:hypothetical protein
MRHPNKSSQRERSSQTSRVLALLRAHRGQRVPCYLIAAVALQYNTRISELREQGYIIVNEHEYHDNQRLSWFRLESEPTPTRAPVPPPADPGSLFGDISPDRSYRE